MVRSGMEPEGRFVSIGAARIATPARRSTGLWPERQRDFDAPESCPGAKLAASAGRRGILRASAACPDARVSSDPSGVSGTDYLYNPFRFISSIESSYRSACTCWPSTHRANRSIPASNDQRGENPSSRRAFEISAKLCRMSPSR